MSQFTWFGLLLGIPEEWDHVAGAVFVTLLLSGMGLYVRINSRNCEKRLIPTDRLGLQNICEMFVEGIQSLVRQITKSKNPVFVAIVGTTFLFILCSNLMGLVPGFLPPTENTNTNFAMAITIFVLYHYFGIRAHGPRYYKQFTGGLGGWLVLLWVLIVPIEMTGHLIRPFSLTLRLWGNINGDHIVLSVFSSLVPPLLPILFLGLGLLVSLIQAFVFSLLSSIYISLAISHEH